MKTIKELKITDDGLMPRLSIIFDDGATFCHDITTDELDEINKNNRNYIEQLIAKYRYKDSHRIVSVWHYVGQDNKLHYTPTTIQCGQCEFFEQTSVYYDEIGLGIPLINSWPYPVGTCKKHGFGPSLSAYRESHYCGQKIATWCQLDVPNLTSDEEKRLIELLK